MTHWSPTKTKWHNLNVFRLPEPKRCVFSLTEASAHLARRSLLAELLQLLHCLLSLGRAGEFLHDLLEEIAGIPDVLQFGEGISHLEHRQRRIRIVGIILDNVV